MSGQIALERGHPFLELLLLLFQPRDSLAQLFQFTALVPAAEIGRTECDQQCDGQWPATGARGLPGRSGHRVAW